MVVLAVYRNPPQILKQLNILSTHRPFPNTAAVFQYLFDPSH